MPALDPLYAVTACGVDPDGNPIAIAVDEDGNLTLAADIDIDTTGLATSANQTSTNTKLDTLHTDLGALATIIGHVDGLEGFVDGLETLIGSTNTAIAATNTALADGTQKVKTSLPTGTHIGGNINPNGSSVQFASQATTIGLATFTALLANTAAVYIGRATGVTTSTGIELNPGDSITLPCANTNEYWAISTASQNVRALAL